MSTPIQNAEQDGGNNDVFDVLEEAQALMEEMDEEGVDSLVIDGFSIDDVFDEPPVIDARTVPVPIQKVEVAVGQDPLSMVNSSSASAIDTDGANTDARRASLTFTVHPLTDEQVTPSNNSNSKASSTSTTLVAPSLADVKARASGFASSISTFAQKAAHAAVAAASDIDRQVSQMSNQHHNNYQGPVSTSGGGGMQQQHQQPNTYPLVAPPAHPHAIELDNDQKNALIQQHLGTLLPGERVIMFLSNLLHVSDSSGWELNNIVTTTTTTTMAGTTATVPPTRDGMWCCCMTFYRVVLFHTASSLSSSSSSLQTPLPCDWDPDCWPTPPQPVMLQMPLASMDRVEKSIYTTAQNTTLMGLVMHGCVLIYIYVITECIDYYCNCFTMPTHHHIFLKRACTQKRQRPPAALHHSLLCRYTPSPRIHSNLRLSWTAQSGISIRL